MTCNALPHLTVVLFDLYGTLLDVRLNEDSTRLWHGLAAVIRTLGGAAHASDVRLRFREIMREEGARYQEGFVMEPALRSLLTAFGARDDVRRAGREFRELSLEELTMRSYVEPLFKDIRDSGCKVGIVSNTEAVLTQYDLSRFPLLLAADTVVLSSEAGVRKPDPRIFQLALERLGGSAEGSAFVGNSLAEDVEGARRAGLRAVHLDDGARGIEPVGGDASALHVEATYAALTAALERLGWRRVVSS